MGKKLTEGEKAKRMKQAQETRERKMSLRSNLELLDYEEMKVRQAMLEQYEKLVDKLLTCYVNNHKKLDKINEKRDEINNELGITPINKK